MKKKKLVKMEKEKTKKSTGKKDGFSLFLFCFIIFAGILMFIKIKGGKENGAIKKFKFRDVAKDYEGEEE